MPKKDTYRRFEIHSRYLYGSIGKDAISYFAAPVRDYLPPPPLPIGRRVDRGLSSRTGRTGWTVDTLSHCIPQQEKPEPGWEFGKVLTGHYNPISR